MLFRLKVLLLLASAAALGFCGWLLWFALSPIELAAPTVEFSIRPGSTLRSATRQIIEAGLSMPEWKFVLLARANGAMKKQLASAWAGRAQGLPMTDPYEALILASLVEKETGRASDRTMIAAVFANRLRRKMKLQTDPSVIYGMGEKFDGNLRKRDLVTDTPFNTYTRLGLPPHPIAMPGLASLAAVMHPAQTDALYFVSRGDGTSEFSRTLVEHNRAVAKYQMPGARRRAGR